MVANVAPVYMEDVTWLRLQVPDWVHRKLKSSAALAGLTLHDYLNKILRDAAENDEEDGGVGDSPQ